MGDEQRPAPLQQKNATREPTAREYGPVRRRNRRSATAGLLFLLPGTEPWPAASCFTLMLTPWK